MRGTDVSNYQISDGKLNAITKTAFANSKFVIIKATQGTNFVNPYLAYETKMAKEAGLLRGYYHYAGGIGTAKKQAAWFYDHIKGYLDGSVIFALDWERSQNPKFYSKTWCKAFLDEMYALSGIRGGVYGSASEIAKFNSCADDYFLWIAGYPDSRNNWKVPHFPYSTGRWKTYDIWQYTSSGGKLDRDTCKWDEAGWKSWAAVRDSAPVQYEIKMATNVRTGRALTYKSVDKLQPGETVTVDRIVTDKRGKTWGHLGKYRWFVIATKKRTRATKK